MRYRSSINHIDVFYDASCGLCAKAKRRLENEPQHIDVAFVALQSTEAKSLLGDRYDELRMTRDVHVLADNGDLWVGSGGWILLLWSTCRWRALSSMLASPLLHPMVKKVVHLIAENRFKMSDLMYLKPDTVERRPPCHA